MASPIFPPLKKAKEIYFIEVDVRVDTWVNFSKYIGNDISDNLKNWFKYGKFIDDITLQKNSKFLDTAIITHFLGRQ